MLLITRSATAQQDAIVVDSFSVDWKYLFQQPECVMVQPMRAAPSCAGRLVSSMLDTSTFKAEYCNYESIRSQIDVLLTARSAAIARPFADSTDANGLPASPCSAPTTAAAVNSAPESLV